MELELKKNAIAVPAETNLSDADLKKMEKQAASEKKAQDDEAAKVKAAAEAKAQEEMAAKLAALAAEANKPC